MGGSQNSINMRTLIRLHVMFRFFFTFNLSKNVVYLVLSSFDDFICKKTSCYFMINDEYEITNWIMPSTTWKERRYLQYYFVAREDKHCKSWSIHLPKRELQKSTCFFLLVRDTIYFRQEHLSTRLNNQHRNIIHFFLWAVFFPRSVHFWHMTI